MAAALLLGAQAQPPPEPASYAKIDAPVLVADSAEVPLATDRITPRDAPDAIDRYRVDPDFQYADPEAEGASLWDQFWDWVARTFWSPIMESTTADGRQLVIVLLAVLGLGWAVARLLRTGGVGGVFARSEAAPAVGLLDVEDIAEVDLGSRLREALGVGDYREAVRVRYLSVLQALDETGALAWRQDKTNRQYVAEVAQGAPPLAGPFRQATRVFDAVWYGERPVSESRYHRLTPLFDAATPAL
ncbi:MAG: DUF4129 domain-containing protein [Bacteroidota bacterium]